MLKTMYKPVSPMCCNCYVLQPRVDPNTPGIRVSILETHTQYPTLRHETWQLTTCPCHFEMKKWRPKSPQSRKWRQTSFVPLQKTIALRVHSEKMKVSSETSSQKKKLSARILSILQLWKAPISSQRDFAYQEVEEMQEALYQCQISISAS